MPYGANGATYTDRWINGIDYTNSTLTPTSLFSSGINDLTCATGLWDTSLGGKPGSGAMLNAVDENPGSHGYTFLQRFTPMPTNVPAPWNSSLTYQPYDNIRVAMVNGYSPYDFTTAGSNSLPGFNGVPDFSDPNYSSKSYYQNVLDGKYPLWTYDHIYDATNGKSTNLQDYINNYTLPGERVSGSQGRSDRDFRYAGSLPHARGQHNRSQRESRQGPKPLRICVPSHRRVRARRYDVHTRCELQHR